MTRAAPIGQRPSLARRTASRSGAVLRFSRKHGGGIVSWTGFAGLGVCAGMWAFTGVVYGLTGLVCAGAMVGGAAVQHHQRNKVINGPNSTRVPWREQQSMADAMRQGRTDDIGQNRTVTVTSHSRDGSGVRSHTRAAPGQAKPSPSSSAPFKVPSQRQDSTKPARTQAQTQTERDWGGESGWGQPVPGFGGKWVKGETDVTGRPLSEHERRNERNYAEWRANPDAPGDYWDHRRGRAITADEMEADRKGRWDWAHRRSVWQRDDGTFEDTWGRPVDDPEACRDRSQPGDDPDTWT